MQKCFRVKFDVRVIFKHIYADTPEEAEEFFRKLLAYKLLQKDEECPIDIVEATTEEKMYFEAAADPKGVIQSNFH